MIKKAFTLVAAVALLAGPVAHAQVVPDASLATFESSETFSASDAPAAARDITAVEILVTPTDKQVFNHLAVGIGLSLTTSSGIVLAMPATPYCQVRIGYNYAFPVQSFIVPKIVVPIVNGIAKTDLFDTSRSFYFTDKGQMRYMSPELTFGEEKYVLDATGDIGFDMNNFAAFVDIYPGKKTGFHFSVGLNYYFKGKDVFSIAARPVGMDPSDYGTLGIGPIYHNEIAYSIVTDNEGFVNARLKRNHRVHPYLGIGFGRAVRPDRRVRVTFDMGVSLVGLPSVYVGAKTSSDLTSDYVEIPLSIDDIQRNATSFSESTGAWFDQNAKLINTAKGFEKFGFFPLPSMKLNVYVRLF